MSARHKTRRLVVSLCIAAVSFVVSAYGLYQNPPAASPTPAVTAPAGQELASVVLEKLPVKGRAPKTNYTRSQFSDGWIDREGCSQRELILRRDLTEVKENTKCQVVSGILNDPYTGKEIHFERGPTTSAKVQIDHVVALGNAWQTGAQELTPVERLRLANDPLELIAVDGQANQQKSDGDAATWLPSNKMFRCQYIARQIAVKQAYKLWVTPPEKAAMARVLAACPGETMPVK